MCVPPSRRPLLADRSLALAHSQLARGTPVTTVALDGQRVRDELLDELRVMLHAAGNPSVTLGTVLVGADGTGRRAMAAKHAAADAVGIGIVGVDLPASATQDQVERAVAGLATDPDVDAIFVQLPLPDGLDTERIADLVPPERDIDGLTARSPYPPAAAIAALTLLERHGIDVTGGHLVLVGRSPYVNEPMTRMLAGRAIVTTVEAPADAPPGATVLDVTQPGGVGPVTIARLLHATARAAGVGH